ncbi:uncharacterized protein LOC113464990 [Ceratina calcarata]|uniref:Uncharacterized protein LOC113464990 n=1 Tax=Ceratina calcarata TaxID=156304 RepID=A0AAJ7SAF8_9HYME|nr:uncharacterized protein LOC113464990 [Ceratina calcarata]
MTAWQLIHEEYNSSLIISSKRTIAQLKKFWSNLKVQHRDVLTKEWQHVLRTEGGPPLSSTVQPDPYIAALTPDLMYTAPVLYTSNNTEDNSIKGRGSGPKASLINDTKEMEDISEAAVSEEVAETISESEIAINDDAAVVQTVKQGEKKELQNLEVERMRLKVQQAQS